MATPKKAKIKPLEAAMQVLNAEPRALAALGEEVYQFVDDGRGWIRVTHSLKRDIMRSLGECIPNLLQPIIDTYHVPEYPGIYWQWTPGETHFEGYWKTLRVGINQLVFQDCIVDVTGREEPILYDCTTTPIWGPVITCNFYDLAVDPDNEWSRALARLVPHAEIRAYMKQAFAAVLAPHNPLKWLLFLVGASNTGKSTLTAAIASAPAGEAGQTSVNPDQAAMRPFSSAHLAGRHVAVIEEFEFVKPAGRSWVKGFTGGRNLSEAKFETATDHVPTAKLIATATTMPTFDDDSLAIQNRLVVVPLDQIIDPTDQYPPMVSTSYWSSSWRRRAVLAWLVEGYAELANRSFYLHRPESVNAEAQRIRVESHSILRVLHDRFAAGGTEDRVTVDEIRQVLQYEGVRDFRRLRELVKEAFPGSAPGTKCRRRPDGAAWESARGFEGMKKVE